MARPGLSEDQIHDVITALEREGGEITVTRIRQKLGTGSYSTISHVLGAWRDQQRQAQQPGVPDIPPALSGLLQHVWLEAWQAASHAYSIEREALAHERTLFEQTKKELTTEIQRLEEEASHAQEALRDAQRASEVHRHALEEAKLTLATAHGRLETFQTEITHVRAEHQPCAATLTTWVERATKAETQLAAQLAHQPAKPSGK